MHRLMTWESAVVPAEGEHFCIVSANLGLLPTVIYFCERERGRVSRRPQPAGITQTNFQQTI